MNKAAFKTVVSARIAALAALAWFALGPSPAAASLSVSPSYIDLEVGKGRPSQAITVANVTDTEMRYRVHVVHFTFSQNGDIEMVPSDEHSLAPWIKCNPREFTLGPKASRAIRITIVPPNGPPPGSTGPRSGSSRSTAAPPRHPRARTSRPASRWSPTS